MNRELRWFTVNGWFRTDSWPTAYSMSVLALSERNAKEIIEKTVLEAHECFQIESVFCAGTLAQYRERFGTDGEFDDTQGRLF